MPWAAHSFCNSLWLYQPVLLSLLLTAVYPGASTDFPREAMYKVVNVSFETRLLGFEDLPLPATTVLGVTYVTSRSLSFLICKMGVVIRTASWGYYSKGDNPHGGGSRHSLKGQNVGSKEDNGILGRVSSMYKAIKARCNQERSSNGYGWREWDKYVMASLMWHFPTIHGAGHELIISVGEGVSVWPWHTMILWINL